MTLGRLCEIKAAGREEPLVQASRVVTTMWLEHRAPRGFLSLGEMKQEQPAATITVKDLIQAERVPQSCRPALGATLRSELDQCPGLPAAQ